MRNSVVAAMDAGTGALVGTSVYSPHGVAAAGGVAGAGAGVFQAGYAGRPVGVVGLVDDRSRWYSTVTGVVHFV